MSTIKKEYQLLGANIVIIATQTPSVMSDKWHISSTINGTPFKTDNYGKRTYEHLIISLLLMEKEIKEHLEYIKVVGENGMQIQKLTEMGYTIE